MAVACPHPGRGIKAKAQLHPLQESHLTAGERRIGTGNGKKRRQHILQHRLVIGKSLPDPVGKGLKTLCILSRLVK